MIILQRFIVFLACFLKEIILKIVEIKVSFFAHVGMSLIYQINSISHRSTERKP